MHIITICIFIENKFDVDKYRVKNRKTQFSKIIKDGSNKEKFIKKPIYNLKFIRTNINCIYRLNITTFIGILKKCI